LAKKTLEITVWDRDRGRSSDYIGMLVFSAADCILLLIIV